jgi:hypothetical protein
LAVDFAVEERARGLAAEALPEGAALVCVEVLRDEVEDGARGDDDELAPRARDGDGEAARLQEEVALRVRELAVGDRGRDDDEVALAALEALHRVDGVGEVRQARGEQCLLRAVRDDDAEARARVEL